MLSQQNILQVCKHNKDKYEKGNVCMNQIVLWNQLHFLKAVKVIKLFQKLATLLMWSKLGNINHVNLICMPLFVRCLHICQIWPTFGGILLICIPLSNLLLWKNSRSLANSKLLVVKENLQNVTKSFRAVFWKWLSNFKYSQLQTFFYDSLHLNTKIISRICSFFNYTHLKIPKVWLKTDFTEEGRNFFKH